MTKTNLTRRLSVFPLVGALLGLSTCVGTAAQEAAPPPLQALFVKATPAATDRAPAADLPNAVPVEADPTLATPPPAPTLAEPDPDAATADELAEVETISVADRLREIHWTAHEDTTFGSLSGAWGIKFGALAELNPGLTAETPVKAGTRLLVYRHDPERPTFSVGSPNRGKLRNGMPLPEGPGWRLRTHRPRTYGTVPTITALVTAFDEYVEKYPTGPKLRIGEIARRNGGRVPPHSSHRSGRDIDIGYIFRGIDDGELNWKYMNSRNFDAEKNWALIQSILKSGEVQTIYVARKLQKLLHKEAAKHLSEAELAELFEYPRTPNSPHAKIQHWRGHANHMHVRFLCEKGNRRCRSRHHG